MQHAKEECLEVKNNAVYLILLRSLSGMRRLRAKLDVAQGMCGGCQEHQLSSISSTYFPGS